MQENQIDWQGIVKQIQDFCTSGVAKLLAQNLAPLSSPSQAKLSQEEIFEAKEVLQTGVRPHMESLDLYEPWHSRVRKRAVLKILEIKDVRLFCLETLALKEALKATRNSWTQATLASLMPAEEPLSAIDQILTPRGDIRSDASETLFRLTKEKDGLGRQINSTLDKLVNDHDMNAFLQDKFVTTREGRWVLPIKSGHQHHVPGVIHGSSQTKQTVFMEPEKVIPLNNRLRQVEVEIEDEIERLLTELSQYLFSLSEAFAKTREALQAADLKLAQAQWSLLCQAEPFEFSESELFLVEVKHPLLQIQAQKPVANTVHLTPQKSLLLLSGPNAGGKTVLLKSIGLAAHMARCGLPICAASTSRLPFFKNIQIVLGDSQNVGAQLSTFAGHLKLLDESARLKGADNLILVDEICGATDPEEGSALARSFIEEFANHQVFAVITSHLGPLKSGWTESSRVLNGSLEYDSKTARPTYQFLPGVPGDSLAIQTAKRIGISKEILDRAVNFLSPSVRQKLAGLDELDQMKDEIRSLQKHLKQEGAKAEASKLKYQKLLADFEKEKDQQLQKLLRQTEKALEEQIAQAKVQDTFKKHTALAEIKNTLPEIIKHKPGTSSDGGGPVSAEDFAKKFPTGSKVFVPSLNQDGIVQSTPNSRGEVMILSQSMRISLPWRDLKPPVSNGNPTASLARQAGHVTVSLHEGEKTLDLRGYTVEEALSELEIQLDKSIERREDRLKIIHGHGTETLKRAVRTYLSRSVYVQKWKSGTPEQGGDGITWVELDLGK
jgi:DNA mismatch repair protein MutS2